jgi:arylsulfatase A-like enzyme
VILLALATAACGGGAREGPFPGAPLILISLDTTRADHLGAWGRPGARTPVLDRLARRGVLFRNAMTAAPTTLASHTSIMTGLYPHTHGVPENGWVIGETNTLLAQRLKRSGYATAGVAGSFALSSLFGIDRGFDRWDESFDLLLHPLERDQNQRRAAAVTEAAIAAAERLGSGPAFLFVHYFDPHAPYDPPPPCGRDDGAPAPGLDDLRELVAEHQEAIAPGEGRGLHVVFDGLTRAILTGAAGAPRAGERDRLLGSLYEGEIACMDAEIGRLLDALEAQGLLDQAVVVVVGDHGETLWEHGDFYNHGLALYQTTIHVPLLIRLPGDRHAGRVVDEPVSTVDILPTILALLGLEAPGLADGVSLLGAIEGRALARGPLFSEATQPGGSRFDREGAAWRNSSRARAVRDGRWKLIHTPYLEHWELFDLASDPSERVNLLAGSGPPPPDAAGAALSLRGILESWSRAANPMPSFPSRERIEEVRERLRALGYL